MNPAAHLLLIALACSFTLRVQAVDEAVELQLQSNAHPLLLRQRKIQEEVLHEDIVGGSAAVAGVYPYYGIAKSGSLCGASLIHTDIAVTAGHCLGVFKGFGLLLGGIQYDGKDAVENVTVLQEYRHPDFNDKTLENDILLLKLNRSASGTVTPIGSINTDASIPADGSKVTAIGFGTTTEGGIVSAYLQQVTVTVLDGETCAAEYWKPLRFRRPYIYDDSMICAADKGKDACQGDSGTLVSASIQ